MTTVLVGLAVLVGAATQRTTGLGFALVAAPFLVLVAGPHSGVSLGNALSGALCVFGVWRSWRDLPVREAVLLAGPALVAVPVGAVLTRDVPDAPMLLVVGSLAVLADVVVVVGRRRRLPSGPVAAVTAGLAGGLMNVSAGVGGPVAAAYGLAQRWPQPRFFACMQLFLLVVNASSFVVKGVLADGLPDVPGSTWLVAGTALVAGAVVGDRLADRVPPAAGQRLVIVVAFAGGVAAIVRGALAL